MHELTLMASMLELIRDQARDRGFARVTRVGLEIGRLSGVDVAAMRFAFDATTAGTVAEGAELEIEQPDGVVRCLACARERPARIGQDACPACGARPFRIVAGRELRLKYLDVE